MVGEKNPTYQLELYSGVSPLTARKDKTKVNTMLLEKEFVNKPAPQEVWLEAIDKTPTEPAATTKVLRSRVRRLRRMQSQNFIERAIYEVTSIFGMHRESA